MLGGVFFARGVFDRAGALTLWVCATLTISIMAFGLSAWTRRVPAAASLVLGVVTWAACVWLALRETLAD